MALFPEMIGPFHRAPGNAYTVAPLRIVFCLKLVDGARKTFLHVAREPGKLPLGLIGNLNAIPHFSRRPRASTPRA